MHRIDSLDSDPMCTRGARNAASGLVQQAQGVLVERRVRRPGGAEAPARSGHLRRNPGRVGSSSIGSRGRTEWFRHKVGSTDDRGACASPAAACFRPDGLRIAIADATRDGLPLVYVNSAFEALTGYDAQEVLGRNCRFLQGVDTDPATIEILRSSLAARSACHCVLLNYRRDGSAFWNELEILPGPGRGGASCVTLSACSETSARGWRSRARGQAIPSIFSRTRPF